jgi:hypothetical protein
MRKKNEMRDIESIKKLENAFKKNMIKLTFLKRKSEF